MISDSPCVPDPACWFDGGKITFYYPAEREAKSRKAQDSGAVSLARMLTNQEGLGAITIVTLLFLLD
jgi:hypothetical protein